jgi:hypothetical protein
VITPKNSELFVSISLFHVFGNTAAQISPPIPKQFINQKVVNFFMKLIWYINVIFILYTYSTKLYNHKLNIINISRYI